MNDGTWRSRIEAVEKERDENAKARDDALEKLQEWRSKAKGLEQRVSEFERSLENARKQLNETLQREVEVSAALEGMRAQRDAASESAKREISQCLLLEQERDEQRQRAERAEKECTALKAGVAMASDALARFTLEKIALETERDAAEADNAALMRGMVAALAMSREGPTSAECGLSLLSLLSLQPHPGAALLEEHRKALVRARNEGLERAALAIDPRTCNTCHRPIEWDPVGGEDRCGAWFHTGIGCGIRRVSPDGYPAGATIIRALKEPEQ